MDFLPLIESLTSLGLGAVIAVLVMHWKREDDKYRREEREQHQQQLQTILDNYHKDSLEIAKLIESDTQATKRLADVVEKMANYNELERRFIRLERESREYLEAVPGGTR